MATKLDVLEQEKKVKDFLEKQKQEILSQNKVRDILDSEPENQLGTDILSMQNPSIQMSAEEGSRDAFRGREDKRESQLERARLINLRNHYNRAYNYAFEEYRNAGYGVQQAEAFARQWAIQVSNQEYQSELIETDKRNNEKISQISARYQKPMLDAGDPYTNAIIGELFSGVASGLGYAYVRNKNSVKQQPTEKTYKSDYGIDESIGVTA